MPSDDRYADVDARGGILEPPGIVEVKYRAPQQAWLLDRLGGSQVQGNEALYGKKNKFARLAIQWKVQGVVFPPEVDKPWVLPGTKTFADEFRRTVVLLNYAKLLKLKEWHIHVERISNKKRPRSPLI